MASRLVNCENTSALWPSSSTSRSCSSSASSLALASPLRFGSSRPGMAGGLAQPQQRFQHLDLGLRQALGLDPLEQRIAVVLAQLVVELALRGLQLAVDGLLGLGRKVARHLLLGAAQDERAADAWASSRRVSSSGLRAAPPASLNTLAAPSMPGLRNSNRLQSSPRWFSTGVPLSARRCCAAQQAHGLGRFGARRS